MQLTKHPFSTGTNTIGCELQLLGGWGVLPFSEWAQILRLIFFRIVANKTKTLQIIPD